MSKLPPPRKTPPLPPRKPMQLPPRPAQKPAIDFDQLSRDMEKSRNDLFGAKQPELLDTQENWEELWKGMPEYQQIKKEPFMSIQVHFFDWDGVQEFAKIIGAKINAETRYLWYPQIKIMKVAHLRYIDNTYDKTKKAEPEDGEAGPQECPDCGGAGKVQYGEHKGEPQYVMCQACGGEKNG